MTAQSRSAMAQFVYAMAYHIGHLLAFRHTGAGLPAYNSPVVGFLVVLYLGLQIGRAAVVLPEIDVVTGLLVGVATVAGMYWLAKGARLKCVFPGFLLLNCGIALVVIVGALVISDALDAVRLTGEAWGVIAFTVFFLRAAKASRAEQSRGAE